MKSLILNKGYANALEQIGGILNKLMISEEIEEIFQHYVEETSSDEAAAILTLAQVIRENRVEEPSPAEKLVDKPNEG